MVAAGSFKFTSDLEQFLVRKLGLFIDGALQSSAHGATLPVLDPATAEPIAQVIDATAQDVDIAVRSAHEAFRDGRWRNLRPADRERILLKYADLVVEHGETLAQLETLEQGKSIALSRMFNASAAPEWMRYTAGLTTKISGRTFDVSLPGGPQHWTAFTRREPIGVVGGIVPWNFPTLIALWKVMPALAAGCSIVLKPSEVTPLSAFLLADLALSAGVPEGVFNVVSGRGSVAGAALVDHPLVRKISFTGSTATGTAIGCAAMQRMARVTLELGGKNPAIILKDADLSVVVPGLLLGGFLNGGQVCAAASRVYIEKEVFDPIVETLREALSHMRLGSGLDETAQVNPLVSSAHRDKVNAYVDEARAAGSDVISVGEVPDQGFFVAPTLVLNPDERAKLVREEIFGPVLGLTAVDSPEDALHRANASMLGLAASLWTSNLKLAMNLAPQIEAGTVWVNSHVLIDPNMPFGGFKQSGIGRDFGVNWLDGYTEEKSFCISH